MIRIFAFLLTLLAAPVLAAPNGTIRVIDADTIDVGGTRVRLFGIDAPEMGQPCWADGREWDCGAWTRDAVRNRFEGAYARCTTRDTDRYGRVVAQCSVDGQDMGQLIVYSGMAWAFRRYSETYDLDEKAAAVAARGLWAVEVEMPSDFRAAQLTDNPAPNQNCAIKGNISSGGRIYHVPGQENYARTRINPANGERWFCSSAEAEAAGWRAARR
ncbi:thermonuclease family protein [Yoonia sp. F2084L]|uniref:thermonuclease family protein n=1 Tax=Yoonia sp. F2084L TaxID=2926419 RepID=UPI001FF5A3C3|nr:thermonuclease family protein [Yoonia sp. F2084L]MCK0096347.1 thermonuclease family protein [Yoonia sp. F2084L]